MSTYSPERSVSIWTILKWVIALLIAVITIFPIWWMVNVVFSLPGEQRRP